MNSVIWLLMVTRIGGSLAGILPVNPGGIGGLFRGPNSETIIRGPDGSEITSEQIGGQVQTEARLEPIVVPDYPDQIALSSVSLSPSETIGISNDIEGVSLTASGVLPSETPNIELQVAPVSALPISQAIPVQTSGSIAIPTHLTTADEPHIIETELVDAPEIEPNQNSELKGPSGSITVRGSTSIISGPASTTISEPVRKIPIATVPIAAPPPAVPSAVLIPPSPSLNVDAISNAASNVGADVQSTLTLNTHLVPPPRPNVQVSLFAPAHAVQPSTYSNLNTGSNIQVPGYAVQPSTYPSPNTELVPPPAPNYPVNLVRAPAPSNADILAQTQTISSTPIPTESLPPNAIDLGQTVVSTTQRSTVAPSVGDIDISRINLGQVNAQQTVDLSSGQLESVSSTVSPINELNVISSTPATSLPASLPLPSETLLPPSDSRTSSDYSWQANSPPTLSVPDLVITSNGASGRTYAQDQGIITNQIITNTARPTLADNSNLVTPNAGLPSTSWLKVEPDNILPTASSPLTGGHGGPISTLLDTVLVQPTDPKNREVIEFNGKQLENVGNIVPVIHHPVLVAGGLTHIHNIPTASVSQLVSRHDFDGNEYNRYERKKRDKN